MEKAVLSKSKGGNFKIVVEDICLYASKNEVAKFLLGEIESVEFSPYKENKGESSPYTENKEE